MKKGGVLHMQKQKRCKKKKWVDFTVTKIKLNPEQAVLACCSAATKTRVQSYNNRQCYSQAEAAPACILGYTWSSNIISS